MKPIAYGNKKIVLKGNSLFNRVKKQTKLVKQEKQLEFNQRILDKIIDKLERIADGENSRDILPITFEQNFDRYNEDEGRPIYATKFPWGGGKNRPYINVMTGFRHAKKSLEDLGFYVEIKTLPTTGGWELHNTLQIVVDIK